jgi:hypothetical protein
MLWILAIIFALVWAIGLMSSFTLGGFLHLLIVVAVVLLAIRLIKGPDRKLRARG